MPEALMTLEEVAAYIQMHEMTIYRLVKAQKIPGFKVGGRWRFRREALDSMFDAEDGAGYRKAEVTA